MSDKITESELIELCKRVLGFNDQQVYLARTTPRLVRMAAEECFLKALPVDDPDAVVIRHQLNSMLNGAGLDVR